MNNLKFLKNYIGIKAWKRPEKLKKVLDSLENCYNIKNYLIYIFVDGGDFQNQQKIQKTISSHKLNPLITTYFHEKNIGINKNTFFLFETLFKKTESYIIHSDDDILFGKDSLIYGEYMYNTYYSKYPIANISFFSREKSQNINICKLRKNTDMCGATIMPYKSYCNFINHYQNDKQFLSASFGWDTYFMKYTKYFNLNELYPEVSRVQNIGYIDGFHPCSYEWHLNHHSASTWIDDFLNVPNNLKYLLQ